MNKQLMNETLRYDVLMFDVIWCLNPTLVIDTSMERSSRVLQHENPENLFSFHKMWK